MICTMSLQLGVRAHLGLHLRLGNAWSESNIGILCTATCRANPTFPPCYEQAGVRI